MTRTYQSMAIVFLFLGILAGSFAGTVKPITINSECVDGIDNDGDEFLIVNPGGIDTSDPSCLYYPFSDGNGETDTPISDRYNSIREYPSLLEYHKTYGGFTAVCDAYGLGIYDSTPEVKAEADTWLNAQGAPRFNCPP